MFNPSPDNSQPKSKLEFELELLKQEYFFLQTSVFDEALLKHQLRFQ